MCINVSEAIQFIYMLSALKFAVFWPASLFCLFWPPQQFALLLWKAIKVKRYEWGQLGYTCCPWLIPCFWLKNRKCALRESFFNDRADPPTRRDMKQLVVFVMTHPLLELWASAKPFKPIAKFRFVFHQNCIASSNLDLGPGFPQLNSGSGHSTLFFDVTLQRDEIPLIT